MPVLTDRVFVSSTYLDLRDYRTEVRDVIQRLGATDVAMEKLGAVDERPLKECLRLVKNGCDLFVGIYAHRYGFVPVGESLRNACELGQDNKAGRQKCHWLR